MANGKVEMYVDRLSDKHATSNSYGILLKERGGKRRLLILIGAFEAQAIAIEIEGLKPMRPLTHDLFKQLAEEFSIRLKEIVINNIKEGIFFSRLVCTDGRREVEIDTRTSDALALAVRFKCPIFTYESVLKTAGYTEEGVFFEDETIEKESTSELFTPAAPTKVLGDMNDAELLARMESAIAAEDYELAAKVRDEMQKRGK